MAGRSQRSRRRPPAHRRRAAARGLVRPRVQAQKRDAGLIRAVAGLSSGAGKSQSVAIDVGEHICQSRREDGFRRIWVRPSRSGFPRRVRPTAAEGSARGRFVKFLLDTNVISEIRRRDRAHPNVARWVARTPVEEIGTGVIVLAEIRRGIELKRRNGLGTTRGHGDVRSQCWRPRLQRGPATFDCRPGCRVLGNRAGEAFACGLPHPAEGASGRASATVLMVIPVVPEVLRSAKRAVTVTRKGQVTIPKPVRDRLGINPGSKVDFGVAEDGRASWRPRGIQVVSAMQTLLP